MLKKIMVAMTAALVLASCGGGKETEKKAATPALDAYGIKMAQSLYVDEINIGVSGGKAGLDQDSAMKVVGIDGAVSSSQLAKEYDANEVAADGKYKGKIFVISGRVQSISKDITGTPFVQLNGKNAFQTVNARFDKDSIQELSNFNKGQDAKLVCKIGGYIIGSATASNCQSLDTFMTAKTEKLKTLVPDVLAGKKSIERKSDTIIRIGYKMGMKIQDRSVCQGDIQSKECRAEINKIPKEQMEKLIAETKAESEAKK